MGKCENLVLHAYILLGTSIDKLMTLCESLKVLKVIGVLQLALNVPIFYWAELMLDAL